MTAARECIWNHSHQSLSLGCVHWFSHSAFRGADWIVLGAYFLVLAAGGLLVSRRVTDSRAYFVGHQDMPSWAVAISVLASALSVATYLGAPESAFKGNLTYLLSNLGTLLAVVVVATWFVPAFYRQRVVTVYELVGNAFGPAAKMAASWTFLLGRTLASGARLFMAAIPAGLILLGPSGADSLEPLIIGVAILTVVGILYTLMGGITSIIWTDVVQFSVMIVAVGAATILLYSRIPLDAAGIIQALSTANVGNTSKLQLVDWSFDPSTVNTVFTAVSGYLLLNLAVYGTDQDLAQRMLTCRNALSGGRSALMAIALNIPVTLLFMVLGLLLFVFYRMPGVMGAAAPAYDVPSSERIFTTFIVHEMPPGMSGLMMAGLFAIAFTSLLSAINAMASAFINDCYRQVRTGETDQHYLAASRWAVVGCGVLLGLVAVGCIFWQRASGQGLIDFALSVMTIPYSGLLGIFLAALFTRRGGQTSALAALSTGILVTSSLQPMIYNHWAPLLSLPVKLAWPWHMVVGTTCAFAVCCLGPRREAVPAPIPAEPAA